MELIFNYIGGLKGMGEPMKLTEDEKNKTKNVSSIFIIIYNIKTNCNLIANGI